MTHPRDSSKRNNRREDRNMRRGARPLAFRITQRELCERSKAAFREFAGDGPDASAIVAEALECSKATAKNYIEGRNVPGSVYDLRAMHAVPSYEAMKRELAALETDIDPRLQAKLVEFARVVQRHGHTLFDGEVPKNG